MEIKFLRRLFDYKTGCLITVDGSGDDKISPQGLENYQTWRLEIRSKTMYRMQFLVLT